MTPKVQLGVPTAPRDGAGRHAGDVRGEPAAQARDRRWAVVRLEFQRFKDGTWAAAKTVKATVADAALGSVYVAAVRLSAAGRWRVRAVHPADDAHAETASALARLRGPVSRPAVWRAPRRGARVCPPSR